MDPAGTQEWHSNVDGTIAWQETQLNKITRGMQQLTQQLSQLTLSIPSQTEAPSAF